LTSSRTIIGRLFGQRQVAFWTVLGGIAAVATFLITLLPDPSPTEPQSRGTPGVSATTSLHGTSQASQSSNQGEPTCPDVSVVDDAISNVYFDVDKCVSSSEPSPNDEFQVSFHRLYFGPGQERNGLYPGTQIWVAKDAQASLIGCPRGRAIDGVLQLNSLRYDETVCVLTSNRSWAVLKFPIEFTSDLLIFDVTLLSTQ
jgi:hypothetical protein